MKTLPSSQACRLSVDEVSQILDVNLTTGMDRGEVTRRRAIHGYNDFEINQEQPLWRKFLEQVSIDDLLIII